MIGTWERVGVVQILALRIYPLDPNGQQGPLSTSVAVEPGHYPVYRKFDAFCWVMDGRINERMEKLGDGLFGIGGGDSPTGLPVSFPSRTYGIDEFRELLADPVCQEGPQQRLRFTVEVQP